MTLSAAITTLSVRKLQHFPIACSLLSKLNFEICCLQHICGILFYHAVLSSSDASKKFLRTRQGWRLGVGKASPDLRGKGRAVGFGA